MKKVIAFGASNSPKSINKQLATYAANRLTEVSVEVLDLNDYGLPVYHPMMEVESGIPENAVAFVKKIKEADAVVVSLAEYNGLHTSAFKNLWDWMSRLGTPKIWHDKPMFLLAASPSRRPESNVMKVSKHLFPLFGAEIVADFSLPSFNHFFQEGEITEAVYKQQFDTELKTFQNHLNNL